MTDRSHQKQTPLAELPARTEMEPHEPDREALAHSVRDHRRAVEETVEALKTKLTRATDRVEHARERVDEAANYLRRHRWPALGAATVIGLMLGARRRPRPPPVQLMLPSGMGEIVKEEKKKTLVQAAFAAIGTMILREVGMRAIAILEDRLLRASNPPEPPVR
jgi:ElaB/YqjD/DUF883 family membrane-anchored ribosome-binding protein